MLRKYLFMTALAAATAGVGVSAQTPAQPPVTPNPASEQAAAASQPAETTVTGCVYREQDIAGRTPNPAEKAGVLEDYILAEIPSASASPAATPGATGTSGTANRMFKLEKIADEKLGSVVGKRVEVTGHVDADKSDSATAPANPAAAPDRSMGPDKVNLAELEVTSIKEVAGTCPASPAK